MAQRLVSRFVVVIVLLMLVGCDHASKGLAKAELETGGARELVRGVVSLRYVENTDIAFSLLRWIPETTRFYGLLVFGAIALVGLGYLLLRTRSSANLPLLALLLVTAGAAGNYFDRIVRGYVVDFVHLKHWPVFNIADIYITAGYAVLAIMLLVKRREVSATDQSTDPPRAAPG